MNYKLLGKSGLRVSELSLGTMTFGEEWGWGANKEVSKKMFDAFASAGGNFLDTADGYTDGTSEKMVGEFVKSNREYFAIATKYSFNAFKPNDPNGGGNHRKHMVEAVNASLKRLNMDYVDLLWMHVWDELTPVEEVMRSFDDLVRAGKVLYIGISDAPAWWIARANTIAEFRGWTQFVGLQIEYNLVERTSERELIGMAEALGLTVTAWSPLASGLLTGKYAKGSKEEKRLDKTPQFKDLSERNLKIADKVVAVAKEVGKSPAQVALNWLRAKRNTIPIFGARTFAQFEDNLKCVEWNLDAKQVARLDEVSKIELGFPMDFIHRPDVRQFLHGGMFDKIQR
jgi:aryl-alcohol dehydrogenase-like predicted oxidoreductase